MVVVINLINNQVFFIKNSKNTIFKEHKEMWFFLRFDFADKDRFFLDLLQIILIDLNLILNQNDKKQF